MMHSRSPVPFSRFARLISVVLALLLALSGCRSPAPEEGGAAGGRALITSPNDERAYELLVLPNQLRVLVVSDPQTDKSAAALAVFFGSFEDPSSRPGLAHFLEHMLFLGTKKFPQPDEYQQFIDSHGGSNNAYTASEYTNYFFDVAPESLEPALDRFSQFFIAPLFTAAYVDREKNAVDSEYNLRLKDDDWRINSVQSDTFNPEHPASRFNIGNLETLSDRPGEPVRDDLVRYYEHHYSANRMALVIVGREPTEVLANWAREYFAAIPDRGLPAADYDVPLFARGQLPERLQVKPVKEQYQISWSFPVPGFDDKYREDPVTYIGNILGHEGKGSLHAVLKDLGWIESLSAGGGRITKREGIVEVTIELTEEGRAHQQEIGDLLFRYIGLVRKKGVQRWLFDEQAEVAKLAFDYQEKRPPQQYAYSVAANFLTYPAYDVLHGPYAMEDYDPALLEEYLSYLRPDNVVVTQVTPAAETDRLDRWFKVPFSLTPLPAPWRARWEEALTAAKGSGPSARLGDALAIVEPNPFLPDSLELVQEDAREAAPKELAATDKVTAWVVTDTEFRVPRASVQLHLETRDAYATAKDAVLATLYVRLVNDSLNQYAYAARIAGLGYHIASDGRGVTIGLSGYSDKQPVLLDRILATLVDLAIDPDKFERYRQELLRDWRNTHQNPPYQQAMEELSRTVLDPYWSFDEQAAAIEPVTPDDLRAWQKQFLGSLRLEALFHGNVTPDRARRIVAQVREKLLGSSTPLPVPRRRLAKLDEHGYVREIRVDHNDSAMALYIQGHEQGYAARARYGLLVQIMRSPFFNDMRTERQLGYLVTVTTRMMVETPGMLFIVQSPVAGIGDLVRYTREFTSAFRKQLEAMPEEEFAQNRSALINTLLQRDQNLRERSARLWGDFDDGVFTFDSREQIAAEVEPLDKSDMEALLDRVDAELERRYLMVYAPGKFPGIDEGDFIDDPAAFKAAREFFTHPADR